MLTVNFKDLGNTQLSMELIHIMYHLQSAKSVALTVFVSTRVGEQIRNKIANLGDNLKYQLTIIQLLHTELKKESIRKNFKESHRSWRKKEQSEEGGRENMEHNSVQAGVRPSKTFQLLSQRLQSIKSGSALRSQRPHWSRC